MNNTVLCVDIGTTSLKAALISKRGRVDAYSRQELTTGDTAAKDWISALAEAVKTFPRRKIAAVCISGNGPTIVSSSGKTLLWNVPIDNGAASESTAEEAAASTQVSKTTTFGFVVDAQFEMPSLFIPRLMAFKERFASAWQQDEYVFGSAEYLIWLLTGAALTVLPEERFRSAYWDDAQLDSAGISAAERKKLPPFASPASLAGVVTKEAAEITGIKKGTKVFCGAPDFIAALVGTNTLRSGDMCDRAGSSEGLNLCTPLPITGSRIRTLPSVIPGLWNASILIPDSGSRFSQFKDKVEFQTKKHLSYDMLATEILEHGGGHLPIPLAIEGKTLLERIADEAKAAVANLTFAAFRTHIETPDGKATEAVPLPDTMTLSGGQARCKQWAQYKCTVADITGKITTCPDAELMGDNIFARVGMNEYKSIQEAADDVVTVDALYFPTTAEM